VITLPGDPVAERRRQEFVRYTAGAEDGNDRPPVISAVRQAVLEQQKQK
jgi:hypothetical protein